MRQRNRIHHKAVRTQNPLHWAKYRLLRNKVIDQIRNSRDNYNKKLTAQINKTIPPGKWWRIVKSLAKLNNKHKPPPPLKINGQTLFHPIEKANALNNFFTSISCIQSQPELPPQGPGPPLHQMGTLHITESEVLDQLQIINTCKPPGTDTVSPKVLKQIPQSIYKPLTKLFNTSLGSGTLPKILKIVQVTPVYKNKGNAEDVNNYRPISVTSVVCKLLEKLLLNTSTIILLKIKYYINSNRGFRQGTLPLIS